MKRLGCLALVFGLLVFGALPIGLILTDSSEATDDVDQVAAAAGVPPRMMRAYAQAVQRVREVVPACTGMRWPILAGVAQIESNQAQGGGRTVSPEGIVTPRILGPALDGSGAGGNTTAIKDTEGGRWDGHTRYDRAVGAFQFLPGTFASLARRAPVTDPHDVDDAALAAAVYLCGKGRDLGTTTQLRKALYGYNHSQAYVDDVMEWVDRFDALASTPGEGASGRARTVIDAALTQIGVDYSWGGGTAGGPSYGICCSPGGQDGSRVVGFDCSGLTVFAYARAKVKLPRTAAAQAGVGTRIPASSGVNALRPGDLVFFAYAPGRDSTIHHVGIYLGSGQMVNAPRPGTTVRTERVWDNGYAGGARVL